MQLHENFEWDEHKAELNKKKHHIEFGDAAYVLADEDGDKYHVEEFDEQNSSDEDRYITTGSHPDDRSIVLRISWTDRSTPKAKVTRIISARAATGHEVEEYVEKIHGT